MFFATSRIHAADEQLMKRIKKGEHQAFEILYDRYARQMLRYFYRMLHGDKTLAQDFLQELFLKVIQRPETFDHSRTFKTWLYTIAYNMCKNEYRRQTVRKNYLAANDIISQSEEKPAETSLDQQYFRKRLMSELEKLSTDQRAAFLLRFQEELSITQISAIMGCPAGTVKSRLFYACKKLSHLLEEFNPKGDG